MSHSRRVTLWVWSCTFAIWFANNSLAGSDPTVWSGLTYEFTRTNEAVPPPVDQITSNVALTRGLTQGLYNAVLDIEGFNGSGPSDTLWATSLNNPGAIIAATKYDALQFDSWLAAYGGSGAVGASIVGLAAVVHLVTDDIYLDLKFTDWQQRGGGGFTYMRAQSPAQPTTTGDYNGNGDVDAADYVLWRETLNQTVGTPGQGADGDQSGTVDAPDYVYWQARFGNIVSTSAAGGSLVAVPEPTSVVLLLSGLFAIRYLSR